MTARQLWSVALWQGESNRLNNFATSNAEIVTGLSKTSAAMAAANNSFDETVALFTAGQEILQNAETMGVSPFAQ